MIRQSFAGFLGHLLPNVSDSGKAMPLVEQ